MSLKQSIVIVSKFGAKAGRTPGRYIRTYTSRLDATEGLTPYTEDRQLSAYIEAYMARQEASDEIIENLGTKSELALRDEEVTPQSSRLFGNRGLVYTKNQFEQAIETTEKALEDQHTLITPVMSFDHAFLVDNGVVPADMPEPTQKGAYKGMVDQLKLRRAITKGMEGLCKEMHFVEPEWTAAIQLDTKHVHAHVTLIETCDHDKVPELRKVKSPRKEWLVEEKSDGSKVKRTEYVRDADGRVLKDDLGERGKLTEKAKASFRRDCERELIYTRSGKAFTNEVSAHKKLVKENAVNLMLSNTKMQMLMMQVYEALPKRLDGDEELSEEEQLKKAQKQWRVRTNRKEMQEAKKISKMYAETVLKDHSHTVGFDRYLSSVEEYAKFRAPDTDNEDHASLRHRLKDMAVRRLEEEIQMKLFDTLKPLRIISSDADLSKSLIEQENKSIESSLPFGVEIPENDVLVVEGVKAPQNLAFSMLKNESVKDFVADGFQNINKPLSRQASLEWRLRSYPSRLTHAVEEQKRYERLLNQYDRLDETYSLPEESKVMRHLYEVEYDYHTDVRDKYHYLCANVDGSRILVDGRLYPAPIVLKNKEVDWDQWADDYGRIVNDWGREFAEHMEADASFPSKTELESIYALPDPLQQLIQNDETIHEQSFLSQLYLDPSVQKKAQDILTVYDVVQQRIELKDSVTPERFREVKSVDILNTLYDFDQDQRRDVKESSWQKYTTVVHTRLDAYDSALHYLEDTGQSSNRSYDYYHSVRDYIQEEKKFIDAVNTARDVRGGSLKIPRPVRQHDTASEDLAKLNQQIFLPPEPARKLARKALAESAKTTRDATQAIRQVDVSDSRIQAMEDLNRLYLQRVKQQFMEDEEETIESEEAYLVQDLEERETMIPSVKREDFSENIEMKKGELLKALSPSSDLSSSSNSNIYYARRHKTAYELE